MIQRTAGFRAAGGEYGQYFQLVVITMAALAARSLKKRLLFLFVGIYFLALLLLISGNLTVYQNSVAELTGFWALEMLVLGIIFILPGYLASCRLLRPLLRWLEDGSVGSPDQAGTVHQAGAAAGGEAAAGADGVTGSAGSSIQAGTVHQAGSVGEAAAGKDGVTGSASSSIQAGMARPVVVAGEVAAGKSSRADAAMVSGKAWGSGGDTASSKTSRVDGASASRKASSDLSPNTAHPAAVGAHDQVGDPGLATVARQVAFRYPWQALVFFAAFGIIGSGLFHLTETWYQQGGAASAPGWWEVTLPTYLSEFSLSIALGLVYFVAARRLLRPFLLLLPPPGSREARRFSIRNRFLVTVVALALTSTIPILVAYLNSFYFHRVINGWGLAVIVVQGLLLSGAVGLVAAGDTATDLTFLTQELNALAHGQRTSLRRPLVAASDDETGDLVLAFNALQALAAAADRELEQELELARRVQAELLPHTLPPVAGWQVSGLSRAAREVGGDFYDILDLGEGRLGIAIGDAAGKGLPAALLMAATIGSLRAEAYREASPVRVLSRINRVLSGTIPAGLFVTLLYMVVDTYNGSCLLSSAGHIDPLVVGPGEGRPEFLPVASLPLGIDSTTRYREQKIALGPGQKILLYTDGVIEARDGGRTLFGFNGLARAVAALAPGQKGTLLADSLCQQVHAFTGSQELEDDLTIVVIEAPEGGATWRRILREPSNL